MTKFEIEDEYIQNFEIHTVGSKICQQLWIPAAALAAFNRHIIGKITIKSAYYGKEFTRAIDPLTNLPKNLNF